MGKKPIYVETHIDSTVDKVWYYTQQPDIHEQWDLRFSSIKYNEKLHEDDPQTFTYCTKVIPGIVVSGWGESKGTHEKESGIKTSSLHFGTSQLISPIKEGRGYWQYNEYFIIWEEAGELHASHSMTLLGLKFLHIDYKIK